MSYTAFSAKRIFTGEHWVHDMAILVNKGIIEDLVPIKDLPAEVRAESFDGMLAPAYIDLQVYGAGGKLFSVFRDVDSLNALHEWSARGGASYCMPTVATNTKEVMCACIDAVREYWNGGGDGVLGLHLEGPWINPVKRGAHIESLIHKPTKAEVEELIDYGNGVIKIITLAPEICSPEIIQLIVSSGVVISAGHSNATYEDARIGFSNGITAVTHLFNAMSPLQHREPGLAGAAMDDARVMSSIIPDGYHVDFAAVRIAKKAMGERLFIITDAVTETSEGPYQHYLAGDKYESAGILSGSALTMGTAVMNLVQHAHIEPAEALRMASLYPAKLMGMDHRMGRIAKGCEANFVCVNERFEVEGLIQHGKD